MMDRAAFAEARLDEDEAAAKAAGGGEWEYRDSWVWSGHYEIADVYNIPDTDEAGIYIALHDPARALREVEAGRHILARYRDCLARMEDPDYPQVIARDQAREYEDFVLPNLLTRWAGHPDYDQERKP